ncbi:(2Fe-2S)-binding protein [Dyella nitratireducens]|uniref:(2Fe-2S)-binding protein n=1 Tax=Dyella nitratireducens TaxID=1849580 RepID=A0ABQ1FYF0_9GAMM|nr:(2Fe-2S)-binding protein [Dyella nitratireducens]GGA33896.1 (2Fe-2S)-binding protein [Dyella nitratireducens]GLQ40791.1 (2Fe-2S)-binding protein [Dyella nitratireducens]
MTQVRINIDGHALDVPAGISVAAAIAQSQRPFRRSVSGHMRAPFCGMGICFECRVQIDGIAQQRSCMVSVRDGMQVVTDG